MLMGNFVLVFLCSELLCAVIEEFLIHLHEQFQSIVDQTMDCPGGKEDRTI